MVHRTYDHRVRRTAPGLFVVLWSTGFIVARYGTRDAGPLTFLALRTLIAALILFALARITGEKRLSSGQAKGQMVAGFGLHALYLGGVFVAIDMGLPSGVSALIRLCIRWSPLWPPVCGWARRSIDSVRSGWSSGRPVSPPWSPSGVSRATT